MRMRFLGKGGRLLMAGVGRGGAFLVFVGGCYPGSEVRGVKIRVSQGGSRAQ